MAPDTPLGVESVSAPGDCEATPDACIRCGIALNIHQVVDLFERIFLLPIDADTQEQRLLAYDARNPPGRSEAGRQQIREGRPIFESQMLELGAIALDGTAPTSRVADQLLAFVVGAPNRGEAAK
jgi:hypothetical protein